MKKCLIWGSGVSFKENYYLIKYYEMIGEISIVGVTSKDTFYKSIYGYQFLQKQSIGELAFDYLIIMSTSTMVINAIKKEARALQILDSKIVPVSVMQLYGFNFDKYKRIKENVPTIFTPNCWGGLLYHSLALPFKSPLINMFVYHKDYIKFLKQPKFYIDSDLELIEMHYESNLKRNYPVVKCGDIQLHFNHYASFEEAKECWNRRKARINWDNIIVMYYGQDETNVNEFLDLPYENKICFTTYESNNENVISINYDRNRMEKPFWLIVNGTASGGNSCLDLFELMLNKRNVLIEGTKINS